MQFSVWEPPSSTCKVKRVTEAGSDEFAGPPRPDAEFGGSCLFALYCVLWLENSGSAMVVPSTIRIAE